MKVEWFTTRTVYGQTEHEAAAAVHSNLVFDGPNGDVDVKVYTTGVKKYSSFPPAEGVDHLA